MPEVKEGSARKTELSNALETSIGPFTELDFSSVSGGISSQIRNRAILAVALASIGILAYIAYAFRNTQNPILYGSAALVAMLHDVLVVLGVFSILGFSSMSRSMPSSSLRFSRSLALASMTPSSSSTAFAKIWRETRRIFEDIVDYSLAQTFVRSLNTSLTVVFTLLALVLFGGGSTRLFVLALLIGVISGTYSSIFNASQILVAWENGEIQSLFRRLRGAGRKPRTSWLLSAEFNNSFAICPW